MGDNYQGDIAIDNLSVKPDTCPTPDVVQVSAPVVESVASNDTTGSGFIVPAMVASLKVLYINETGSTENCTKLSPCSDARYALSQVSTNKTIIFMCEFKPLCTYELSLNDTQKDTTVLHLKPNAPNSGKVILNVASSKETQICFSQLEIVNLTIIGNVTLDCSLYSSTDINVRNVTHINTTFAVLNTFDMILRVSNSTYLDSFLNYTGNDNSILLIDDIVFNGTLPVLDNQTAISSRVARSYKQIGISAYLPMKASQHTIKITDSSFYGLYQHSDVSKPLGGVTVHNTKLDSSVKILIENCSFNFNERAIDFSVKGDVDILISESKFYNNFGNGSGGAVRMTGTLNTGLGAQNNVRKAKLNITKCTFENNFAELSTMYNVSVDRYYQTRSPGSGGAIHVFVIVPSQLLKDGIVNIEHSQFHNNTGDVQGGTVFVNPDISTSVQYCNFTNTRLSTRPKFGDIIYATCNMTLRHNELYVSTTDGTTPLLSYQAADASNYRLLIENVTLYCPTGHWVEQLNTSSFAQVSGSALETLQVYCRGCQASEYSLNISKVFLNKSEAVLTNQIICTRCPYGASCNRGILNTNDFWGKQSSSVGTVVMYPCPQEYCTENDGSGSILYDACADNRGGTLCGRCNAGYSESLFGTECINNDQCGWHNWWVAFLLALYGIGYVLFFMFEHDWERFIKYISDKVQGIKKDEEEENNVVDNSDMSQSGYFQIFMYYIQTSALLKVKIVVQEDEIYKNVHRPQDLLPRFLIDGIKEVFSFDISFLQQNTCLLKDLNVVLKTEMKLLFVAYCFVILLLMYIFSGFCCVFLNPKKRPQIGPLSNTVRLLLTVLSLFLYTYQSVAEDAFLLLNCVSVDGERVLFYDGTVNCLQEWQYYVIALVVVFVIPFFIILLFGPKVLDRKEIGTVVFFIACIFPLFLSIPITLMYFGVFSCKRKKEGKKSLTSSRSSEDKNETNFCCGNVDHIRNEVVDALTGPYRDDIFKGICYEGILNFRRMIMVVMFTFITDILLKQMALALCCFVILIIHIKAQPFKQQFSNIVETIALSMLLVISGTNLVKAAFYHSQTIPRGTNYLIIVIYEWLEAICLGILPIAIIFFVILGMLLKQGKKLARCLGSKKPKTDGDFMINYHGFHNPNVRYPYNDHYNPTSVNSFERMARRWQPRYDNANKGYMTTQDLITPSMERKRLKRVDNHSNSSKGGSNNIRNNSPYNLDNYGLFNSNYNRHNKRLTRANEISPRESLNDYNTNSQPRRLPRS